LSGEIGESIRAHGGNPVGVVEYSGCE
jgi:hypothetical protein